MKTQKDIDLDQYVAKSNEMIRHSRYNLTAQQQKIILYAISKIRPEDSSFQWYDISIQDLCRACGVDAKNGYYYTSIRNDMKKLMNREFGMMPDGSEISISWIGDVQMKRNDGTIRIIFNPNMRDYLFQLKERYTQYKLENVLCFSKPTTIRLYELIRSYTTQGKLDHGITTDVTLDLDDLRSRLDYNGKYEKWFDFSRFVLKNAIAEINEKNEEMHVEYEPVRVGRFVQKVHFTISAPSPSEMWAAHSARKKALKQE